MKCGYLCFGVGAITTIVDTLREGGNFPTYIPHESTGISVTPFLCYVIMPLISVRQFLGCTFNLFVINTHWSQTRRSAVSLLNYRFVGSIIIEC